MQVVIDKDSGVPYSRQVRDGIIQLIRSGRLGSGARLLPSRDMARVLGVSRGTVVKAYEDLESTGWVKTRVGDGTFVSLQVGEVSGGVEEHRARGPAWAEMFSRYVTERQSHLLQDLAELVQEPGAINFAAALPPEEYFPVDDFRRALNHVIKRDGRRLLQFGSVSGTGELREYIRGYLKKRGIVVSVEEILVVNGIQQGLDLTAKILLEPGDAVILESPTYPGAIALLRACQARILTVPLRDEGFSVDLLKRLVMRHQPKLFYCIPSYHNPTGLTLPQETRSLLMQTVSELQLVVVEDDCTGDLAFGSDPPIPLKALDRHHQVIFIGSFSKHLFPGLRIGWVVAEPRVIKSMMLAKSMSDLHTNGIDQGVMAEFCARGLFEIHLRKMRGVYRRNCGLMLKAMKTHFPEQVAWTEPRGGISLWVTLPAELDVTGLFFKARDRGVLFTPGTIFHPEGGGQNGFRLNFSRVNPEKIEEGIIILGNLMREMIRDSKNHTPVKNSGTPPLV